MKLLEVATVLAAGYVATVIFIYDGKIKEATSYPWSWSECRGALGETSTSLKKDKRIRIVSETCKNNKDIQMPNIDADELKRLMLQGESTNGGTMEGN